jgi:hypothetical protein
MECGNSFYLHNLKISSKNPREMDEKSAKRVMDKYRDPVDIILGKQMVSELMECKTANDLFSFTNKYFNGWIRDKSDHFSSEYSKLQENWELFCKRVCKTSPQEILLVEYMYLPPLPLKEDSLRNHAFVILMCLCDKFTSIGYCVRNIENFRPCEICHGVHVYVKEENRGHSQFCESCLKYQSNEK